ncbi:MAG: hypothetical protein M1275_01810 [Patescibacteria group bacterium]|nr:hypothetical protein [Patescibacteria group bacterium]
MSIPLHKKDDLGGRTSSGFKNLLSFLVLKDYASGKLERLATIVALLVNIILWVLVLIKTAGGGKPIPLHYSVIYGIDYVGSSFLLLELPAIGLFLFIVNFYLAAHLSGRERFLSRLVIFTSALLQCFLLLAAFSVLYLNR